MVFKFKYRLASDSILNYQKRNNRMLERHLQRYAEKNIEIVILLDLVK